MKRITTLCLLLLAVICLAQSPQTSPSPQTADELLNAYTKRVRAELMPRIDDITPEEMIRVEADISAELLVPHKDLLMAKAKSTLSALPKSAIDLTSGWETYLESGGGLEAHVSEHSGANSQPATHPVESDSQPATHPAYLDALHLKSSWNPLKVAVSSRAMMLMHNKGSNRLMLDSLAPPIVSAISADPQHPVLAFERDDEVFVVYLKLTDKGYYIEENVKWLRKVKPTTAP